MRKFGLRTRAFICISISMYSFPFDDVHRWFLITIMVLLCFQYITMCFYCAKQQHVRGIVFQLSNSMYNIHSVSELQQSRLCMRILSIILLPMLNTYHVLVVYTGHQLYSWYYSKRPVRWDSKKASLGIRVQPLNVEELTPQNCSLTSTRAPKHEHAWHMHTHPHTHICILTSRNTHINTKSMKKK